MTAKNRTYIIGYIDKFIVSSYFLVKNSLQGSFLSSISNHIRSKICDVILSIFVTPKGVATSAGSVWFPLKFQVCIMLIKVYCTGRASPRVLNRFRFSDHLFLSQDNPHYSVNLINLILELSISSYWDIFNKVFNYIFIVVLP